MPGALWAVTTVEEVSGQWVVVISVLFEDGVVTKRLGTYRSRRLAEIAARLIEQRANLG